MSIMINLIQESFSRSLKNYLSYKFNFFGEVLFSLVSVMFIFFVSEIFTNNDSIYLAKYYGNYFLFLFTGLGVIFFITKTFNIKFKQYQDIEISDDENEKNNEIEYKDKHIMCIFIPNLKKWKPYKKSNYNNIDSINKIKYIENH